MIYKSFWPSKHCYDVTDALDESQYLPEVYRTQVSAQLIGSSPVGEGIEAIS